MRSLSIIPGDTVFPESVKGWMGFVMVDLAWMIGEDELIGEVHDIRSYGAADAPVHGHIAGEVTFQVVPFMDGGTADIQKSISG